MSGLRQPQTYTNTRLPLPDSFNRGRRQSLVSSIPLPPAPTPITYPERPVRMRTMSDAPRIDTAQQRTQLKDRRIQLRRSLFLEHNTAEEDETESDEDTTKNRKYRVSAPLLDAYGVPTKGKAAQKSKPVVPAPPANPLFNLPPSDLDQKIRVCVRKRPLNKKELDKAEKDIAFCAGARNVQINEPRVKLDLTKYTEQHSFIFDDVFDSNESNAKVYERTALPLVKYIFEGGKATCFAYGQTGSGKTYTMLDPEHGLYIMAARDIFNMLHRPENQHLAAWIGLYEIYQGHLFDLLGDRKKLFAREDGKKNVIVSGLKEYPIDNVDKLIQVFEYGSSVRSTGSTVANNTSSRSHAVLQILLKHKSNRKKIHGKLSFIDLAGSERGADRGGETDTKTRMEGAEINKSLLALKECIRALDLDKRHTPFRQSKLTQVLKDSFVGKSRTCMIATISPGGSNSEHTLNTLRYADRVKELKGERENRSKSEQNYELGTTPDENHWMDSSSMKDEDDEERGEEDDDEEYMHDSNDEYYSNESDILDDDTFNIDEENIFDVDFPHEQDALIHSTTPAPVLKTNYSPQDPDTYMGYTQSPTMSPSSPQRPLSLQQMKRSSSIIPRSQSMYSPRTSTDTTSDSSLSNSSTQRQSMQSIEYSQTSSVINGVPSFNYERIDEFIKFHRAEIREITECTKYESKLVANISLNISSNQDYQDELFLSKSSDDKSSLQFEKYLRDLDELLERKLAAIEALRDRISETVGEVEF
ncbi:P-loop containing nucleoside triphosphate hydrolase protein [Pilobolus umbonatus]|nr:P-loop containing nucleoside triphosphate hydrolase protein [Pilobolus umbonatus]